MCDEFEKSSHNSMLNNDLRKANSFAKSNGPQIELKSIIDYKSGFFTQFRWLLWRTFLSMVRDPFSSNIALIQTIVNL